MTLKQMIDSPEGQYMEVKAAYWAGQEMGRAEAYKACQQAVWDLLPLRLRHVRGDMMERLMLDRACNNAAAEILSWEFD